MNKPTEHNGITYRLEGKQVVPCSWEEWEEWFNQNDGSRIVAKTIKDEILISTVFIGLNHNLFPENPLRVFETMVFGGPLDGERQCYATWEEAELGHAEMCKEVWNELNPP